MVPSYLQLRRYDDALEAIDRWSSQEQEPWAWAWKAAVYGRSGRAEEAQRALAKAIQTSGSRADRTALLLVAYSGQKESVIDLLQKAYSEHSNAVVPIKVDPIYDSIRNDPRVQDLLRRMGFQP